MLPMKKSGSLRLAAGSAASDWPMCDSAGVGEHHALGQLTRQRHHLLAQRRDDDRRQRAEAGLGAELLDEGARVGQRLARRHAHPHMRRAVRDADAHAEPAARDLVHHRGALREVDDGALVDRRDRRAEGDRRRCSTTSPRTSTCCRSGSARRCRRSRASPPPGTVRWCGGVARAWRSGTGREAVRTSWRFLRLTFVAASMPGPPGPVPAQSHRFRGRRQSAGDSSRNWPPR